ncbi:MAG: TatD family hydrolase [Peptococcaceae bacterium]|nr:TatD family hydrolase [Peptococcaceae bacterium]
METETNTTAALLIWDTHAHLDDRRFKSDLAEVLRRAQEAGIRKMLNVGHSEATSRRSIEMAERYEFMYASVGAHPHDAKDCTTATWDKLAQWANHAKVVAWGEIGLDYYRDLSPRDVQKKAFIEQIELANAAGLPIIIHNRDAHGDLVSVVKEHPPVHGGVFHSYSGSWDMAKGLLNQGFFLSFSGPLTYPDARRAVEVAAHVPGDRFLVETDCPYLPPQPHRGQRNEPAYVHYVVERLAQIRNIPYEEVARLSSANAEKLFQRARSFRE